MGVHHTVESSVESPLGTAGRGGLGPREIRKVWAPCLINKDFYLSGSGHPPIVLSGLGLGLGSGAQWVWIGQG